MNAAPPRSSPVRRRIRALRSNGIGQVSSLGLGDPNVIPLWFGESDLVTPEFIRAAAKRALDEGKTFYTFARGIPPLREAIAAFHRRTVGMEVPIERITVPGAAMLGVVTALQCLIETGDNVVCISPVWPNIFQAAAIAGAELRFVRLDEDWRAGTPRWTLDLDRVFAECDSRTRAIFVASPGNPTGWVMTRADQEALLAFSRKHGIAILSDEVYGTLIYDAARSHAPSFLEIAGPEDDVFVINSFSKPWAMTGWRLGWLVHSAGLGEQMMVMSAANNTGATVFAQYGGIAALSPEGDAFRGEMLARCRNGRGIVADFVSRQNRTRWIVPDGAFYGFIEIDGLADSLAFAKRLVREAGVGVAPGSAFGPAVLGRPEPRDEAYIRICFAQDPARLAQGLDRLGRAIAAL